MCFSWVLTHVLRLGVCQSTAQLAVMAACGAAGRFSNTRRVLAASSLRRHPFEPLHLTLVLDRRRSDLMILPQQLPPLLVLHLKTHAHTKSMTSSVPRTETASHDGRTYSTRKHRPPQQRTKAPPLHDNSNATGRHDIDPHDVAAGLQLLTLCQLLRLPLSVDGLNGSSLLAQPGTLSNRGGTIGDSFLLAKTRASNSHGWTTSSNYSRQRVSSQPHHANQRSAGAPHWCARYVGLVPWHSGSNSATRTGRRSITFSAASSALLCTWETNPPLESVGKAEGALKMVRMKTPPAEIRHVRSGAQTSRRVIYSFIHSFIHSFILDSYCKHSKRDGNPASCAPTRAPSLFQRKTRR